MPKGSREGKKCRVKNKPKKIIGFKGKRFSDIHNVEDENRGPVSQSTNKESVESLQDSSEPHQVMDEDNLEATDIKSASARKLENANKAPTRSTSPAPQTPEIEGSGRSKKRNHTTSLPEDGHRVVYIENIRKALESMHKCKNGKITICEDASKRAGLSSTFYFECTACKQRVDMDTSKNVEGKARSFDVNRRTNFAMSELGLGKEALATICEI